MAYSVTAPEKPLSDPMLTSDLVRFCSIYMGVMLQRVHKVLVCMMGFKINSKLLPRVPGTNEFKKTNLLQ